MHGENAAAESKMFSTDTKRAGLNIILAPGHAAVGRELVVVPNDGLQIRLTLDYKNAHSIKLRSASPQGEHHRALPQLGFDVAPPYASFFTTLRKCDDPPCRLAPS
jgi:hypothetical protein